MTLALGMTLTLGLVGCGGGGVATTPTVTNNTVSINQTVSDWIDELETRLAASGQNDAAQARSIAIVTTAMYDAYALLDNQALAVHTNDESLQVRALPTHAETAVAQAAYSALYEVFPNQRGELLDRAIAYGINPDDTNTYLDSAVGIGNLAARNVVAKYADELRYKSADFTARKPFSVTASTDFSSTAQGATALQPATPRAWFAQSETALLSQNHDLAQAVAYYLQTGNAIMDAGIAASQNPAADTSTAIAAAVAESTKVQLGSTRMAMDTTGADDSWKSLGTTVARQVADKANRLSLGFR